MQFLSTPDKSGDNGEHNLYMAHLWSDAPLNGNTVLGWLRSRIHRYVATPFSLNCRTVGLDQTKDRHVKTVLALSWQSSLQQKISNDFNKLPISAPSPPFPPSTTKILQFDMALYVYLLLLCMLLATL